MQTSNHIPTAPQQQYARAIPIQELDREKQSWWNGLTDKQRDAIIKLAIALGVSVVAIIVVKFVQSKIQDIRANQAESGSFGKDKNDTWAKQFEMAFANNNWFDWGTDENLIRRTLIAIPSKNDFEKVKKSYTALTKGGNLIARLTKELRTTEYNEMLAIMDSKPQKAKDAGAIIYDPYNWAKRLYNAMSIYYGGVIPGTDEDAIKAVFAEMPSQKAFKDTEQAYQIKYHASLADDLDGDLNWTMDWKATIQRKPLT